MPDMAPTQGVVASPPSTMNPTPPTGAAPDNTPPASIPGTGEVPPAGEMEQAKATVQIAIQVLEQVLPKLGSTSEEGQAVYKALGLLSKQFSGKRSENLGPAELMQMMQTMPDQYKEAMAAQMGGKAPGEGPAGGM